MTLRAVVLAAGESRRLGEPKALAQLGPRCALEHLLSALAVVDPSPLVITGAHDSEIRARLGSLADCLANPHWSEGRTSGVLLARATLPSRDLLIAPVDVPLVAAATVAHLAQAWHAAGEPELGWLAPRLGEQGPFGHPVIVGRTLLATLEDGKELRSLRERAQPLEFLAVADPAIVDDLDTPADLARLRRRLEFGRG